MGFVTPRIAFGFFLVILVVAGIIAWRFNNYSEYDKGAFHTFIAILAGLGIFVTFLFYYSVIELQQQQQAKSNLQELCRINDAVLNSVLNEIKQASLIVPNFVLSINPLDKYFYESTNQLINTSTNNSHNSHNSYNSNNSYSDNSHNSHNSHNSDNSHNILPKTINSDNILANNSKTSNSNSDNSDNFTIEQLTTKQITYIMILSYRIFSLWQDVIVTNKLVNVDPIPYISNFLQKANSKLLYDQWVITKINFSIETQKFGDLLFDYGQKIIIQTPKEYVDTATKLINDKKYIEIFN